ncbi:CpaD family pilus assembly lipoprotein [Methylobacterium sp. J-076]|uniref:CpaD family pilus assembly lipoprotein n=1 Tax=Methylobacterium sp. J-076 TaxID=2836655 RepID=UPI001FB9D2B4|nr:CpaD family pilus assembly lipoprotein [Methylobacterium sp. J-076]MCJ2013113.1 CpaD family pilus assembly lipoprotein [Methylobacterium sp. J-076]
MSPRRPMPARRLLAGIALAALAACTPAAPPPALAGPPPPTFGDGQEVRVEGEPVRLLVGRGGLPLRRLAVVLGEVSRGRIDALHLELHGRDRSVLRAVAAEARRAGVDPLKIQVVPGPAPFGAVEVLATRFVAVAPLCPSLAIIDPSVNDNDFEPTLGCSNRRNLAAMVNDPADLHGNDAVVPADGARASLAIARYRTTPPGGPGFGQGVIDPGAAGH